MLDEIFTLKAKEKRNLSRLCNLEFLRCEILKFMVGYSKNKAKCRREKIPPS